ncbi:transcriptional regulator, LacI family [Pseudopedobacter saltans DSM 12145]|uniref:Transcriptional regulator, LacI family n=1 Tax=Pseudopedobacter saltans (strain ATCC 51119 / DSM 12145 / JCM 21818 / CCUG 39354 / LMG 10337 / NBRC 100064 / NCIMB 13643) TaxID=762903 RepID=F0SBS3_PSESL|nr:LacI family DNA-binding transcriptional regulator [Pseudopedobacter saltans]ADY52764.1 transcriptional regulator, LacI family [Pseudopedobacter saltans DSM 12145]
MKIQSVTIKDIAAEVGMSVSSVSRALSDHPHISEDTKQKVKEAATKLGYRYNALAAALRNSRSKTIGLIVPRISMSFQSAVITAIQNKLQEFNYNVIICQSNESPEIERNLVQILNASRVDGLIVSCSIYTEDFSHFSEYQKEGVPIIFYDRVPTNFQAHKIKGDDFFGAYQSTMHLIDKGCERIVHIGGPLSCNQYVERFNGYKEALVKKKKCFEEGMAHFHELSQENALKSVSELYDRYKPDAFFTSNDSAALAVIQYAKSKNLNIPKDLKLVGYSNDNRTTISCPQISSVEQFPHEMGEQAAILMMDLLDNKVKTGRSFISLTTPVELIERESSF